MYPMENQGVMMGRSNLLLGGYNNLPQNEKDLYIIISKIMASIIKYIKRNPELKARVLDTGLTSYPVLMGRAWSEHNELGMTKRFGTVVGKDFGNLGRMAGKLEEMLNSSKGELVEDDVKSLLGIHAQCQVMFEQYLGKQEYLKEVLDAYRQRA